MPNLKMKSITAIVPVYNEEKTVGHVLQVLVDSGKFNQIICINDGSKDQSVAEIKKNKKVDLMNFKVNRGKGFAVGSGIKRANSDLIAFIDSDLSTLTKEHIDKMVDPMLTDPKIDGVIAYENGVFLSVFSGQRVYRRKDLIPLVKKMKESDYGIEVLLNAAFRDKNILQVQLTGLGHIEKFVKRDKKSALTNYISQWFINVFKQMIKSGISTDQFISIMTESSEIISTKIKKAKDSKNK